MTSTLYSSQTQTSITSSLISSSHNNHSKYVNKYPNQTRKIGPWVFHGQLGRGSSAKVMLGIHEETGESAAVKIINKNHLNSSDLKPNELDSNGLPYGIQREIIIMKLLNNQNILKLYDVYESKNHLYLITEFVKNGELFEYLLHQSALPENRAITVFNELINGVSFLHNWGIIHRDLKLENILIDDKMHVKIADFGMATLQLLNFINDDNSSTIKKVPAYLLETSCGSPHYAAPEVITSAPYNGLKSDIWSCGVIYYALLTGRLPFDDDNIKDLLLKVKIGKFDLDPRLSKESKELLLGMLNTNVDERYDINQILNSSLFKKYNLCRDEETIKNTNMQFLTNSINADLIKTNNLNHLIINNFNFNKKLAGDPANVDEVILSHLMILYHNKKDKSSILKNLLNNKVNIDKVFYSLLINFNLKDKKHNGKGKFLSESDFIGDDVADFYSDDEDLDPYELEDYNEEDLEEYPAQLNLNSKSKMTKTYSNISIIAASSHKRNVSFSHNRKKMVSINSRSSLYRNGSLYRYSNSRLNQSNTNLHLRSNKSISSYTNANYTTYPMRTSGSIASYNGSLNLHSYLVNNASIVDNINDFEDFDEEDENDDDEGIQFDDEAINVESPGVPLFRFQNNSSSNSKYKQNIEELASIYKSLDIEDKICRDNFDFEVDGMSDLDNEEARQIINEIDKTMSIVNYKISPGRTKRYKTTSMISSSDNVYVSNSPVRKIQTRQHNRMNSKHNSLKISASRKTINSKILSNYNNYYYKNKHSSTMFNIKEIENITIQTKNEFELLCDEFFSRSDENYKSIFGESYIERKLKEREEMGRQKQKIAQEKAEKLEKAKKLKQNGTLLNRPPISKLDPGLTAFHIKSSQEDSNNSTLTSLNTTMDNNTITNCTTNTTINNSYPKSRKSSNAAERKIVSDIGRIETFQEEFLDIRTGIEGDDLEAENDDNDEDEDEEDEEEVDDQFEFIPTGPSAQFNERLLKDKSIGDSTKDLVKKTLIAESNYKDIYKYSIPEITNLEESPFLNTAETFIQPKKPEPLRAHTSYKRSSVQRNASMPPKVKVFYDTKNMHDSSYNLVTNGQIGSLRNMTIVNDKSQIPTKAAQPGKRSVSDTTSNRKKGSHHVSLFKKFAFGGKKKEKRTSSAAKVAQEPVSDSNFTTNKNKNKEIQLRLSKEDSITAIKSILNNWKKCGLRDVRLTSNVISGIISESSIFDKKTGFKIFFYEGNAKNKTSFSIIEFQKIKGSTLVFNKFLQEIEKVLMKEKVILAQK